MIGNFVNNTRNEDIQISFKDKESFYRLFYLYHVTWSNPHQTKNKQFSRSLAKAESLLPPNFFHIRQDEYPYTNSIRYESNSISLHLVHKYNVDINSFLSVLEDLISLSQAVVTEINLEFESKRFDDYKIKFKHDGIIKLIPHKTETEQNEN